MRVTDSFLEELNSKVDLVDLVSDYVALKKMGSEYVGLCPFHSERSPSFYVNQDSQLYYCFGCHRGGSAIQFIMEQDNLEFMDAVEVLARRVGMQMPEDGEEEHSGRARRERILALNTEAAHWFHNNLSAPEGAAGARYLLGRGLTRATITRFGLGVAPDSWDGLIQAMAQKGYEKADLLAAGLAVQNERGRIYDRFRNRVMFPIIDVRGSVVGFGGRVLDDAKPKYLNSPDTAVYNKSRTFFALNFAKKSKQGRIILTEGYMDAIALHQAGFDCAVASCGTSLTEEHVKLLGNYTKEVVISYDADKAGTEAAQRAIRLLERTDLTVRVLQVPEQKDPDEYIRDHGAVAFEALLTGSSNQVEYRLSQIRSGHDLEQDAEKVAFLQEAAKLVAGLQSPVEREIYGKRAAQMAGLSYSAMEEEVRRLRDRSKWKQRKNEERRAMSPAQISQPQSRELRYKDVASGKAEEGLVRLLLKDAEFFRQTDGLRPEEFTSPTWGKVYGLLRSRWETGAPCTTAFLSGRLTPEEMSLLVGILRKPESVANGDQALADYIRIIRRQRFVDDDSALMAYRQIRNQGNGGSTQ